MSQYKYNGKGQVFSLDVLFSLLPVMMIIGASLQYLYISEEQATSIAQNSQLEVLSQGLAGAVMGVGGTYAKPSACAELGAALAAQKLPASYVYHAQVFNYFDPTALLCNDGTQIWSDDLNPNGQQALTHFNNTAASQERFVLEYDASTGALLPGHIAGISFTVWKQG